MKNVRDMQKLFAGFQGLSELLNEASVLYTTCIRAFDQTLSHELNSLPRNTPPDSPLVAEAVANRHRTLLFARIGVLYSNVQEFDPDNSHRFMIIEIFTVLRTQALIFASLHDVIPEINDPLLLETRFPQFIRNVNHFMECAREHFAQYYPNSAEQ